MEDVSGRVDAFLHLFGEKKDWVYTESIHMKIHEEFGSSWSCFARILKIVARVLEIRQGSILPCMYLGANEVGRRLHIPNSMASSLPMFPGPQVVPSSFCIQCKVCCRFPEQDSALRPYFTAQEIHQAIEHGIDPSMFPVSRGSRIQVVPHPAEEGFLCPAFDPVTHHCRIYKVRPLDCRLYPFALMWNASHDTVLFGWDTLCPFLPDHSSSDRPGHTEGSPDSPVKIPPVIIEKGRAVAAYLESPDVLNNLAAHPAFVTPYQTDVVVLQPLARLTDALRSSRTHGTT